MRGASLQVLLFASVACFASLLHDARAAPRDWWKPVSKRGQNDVIKRTADDVTEFGVRVSPQTVIGQANGAVSVLCSVRGAGGEGYNNRPYIDFYVS